MSARARRSRLATVIEGSDDDEEEQPVQVAQRAHGRRSRRAHIEQTEDDDDYAPGANGADEEDEPLEDELEEEGDGEDEDDPEEELTRVKSEKKRRSGGGQQRAPKRTRQPNEHVPFVKFELDPTRPLVVPQVALQAAENKIVNYNNEAEQHLHTRGNIMTQQGINALVRLVVRYMIFANSERPGVPISRAEVSRIISENLASKNKNVGPLVIACAQAKLAENFGLEMVELIKPPQRNKDKGPPAAGEGSKHFVLRSLVPPVLYSAVVEQPTAAAARGLLVVIMSIIDMAGGSIEEEELWKHLADVGVTRGIPHPALGVPGEMVESFVKRRQLQVDRVAGNDGTENYYRIAENASDEVGTQQLKGFYEAEFQ